ncbi:transmembrane prolyl 4-hydroxylase [Sinocyclocheilus grahami]|uniref:transmembrane prolyl 4-hydroxylase n=1 Tax=Sinocyclocheilus grahami TaxID=75366 RepID=UPI0007AD594E|nr:PREDICTED: transmembrane prolyl 4-hydroxylase-like [Sinocyclocheilus grahami]
MGEYEDRLHELEGEARYFPPPPRHPGGRERLHIQKSSVCSRAYFVVVMAFFHIYIINIIALLLYVHYNTGSGEQDVPLENSAGAPRPMPAEHRTPSSASLSPELSFQLPRLEGIRVGHVQRVSLVPDRTHNMRTLSLKPLLFEIPGFLSVEESSVVMQLAQLKGLTHSSLLTAPDSQEEQLTQDQLFSLLDLNQDGLLQREEVRHSAAAYMYQFSGFNRIKEHLGCVFAGVLSLQEFKRVSGGVLQYSAAGQGLDGHAKVRQRSTHTRLYLGEGTHHLLKSIRNRVTRLTRLPSSLVDLSEPMEVVRYEQGGYSHAHHDSGPTNHDSSCAHTHLAANNSASKQVACRYLTVLLHLNPADGGGETSFPVADNRTYEEEVLGDLSQQYCDKGNLKVKPVAGTALLWYNHLSDGNGWVGELDEFSLHGDCLVTRGFKWTGSVWVNIDPEQQRQERYQRLVSWHPDGQSKKPEHGDLHQDL